jgi:L-fuconolactonase
MNIAHQHFWSLARGDYPWLAPDLSPLYRGYLPADLKTLLETSGIARTILVQAAPTEAETAFLLQLADGYSFIAGVVGWTDLAAAVAVTRVERAAAPKLVGFRPCCRRWRTLRGSWRRARHGIWDCASTRRPCSQPTT